MGRGRARDGAPPHYHSRLLRSPTELTNAIRYVLGNAEHHFGDRGRDYFSPASPDGEEVRAEPRGWLLREGWKRGRFDMHRLGEGICEVKRLCVRPHLRGRGVGKLLVEAVIAEARKIGYRSMRLDTIGASMQNAVALYRTLGFKEISPYRDNPIPTATYLELNLA